MESTPIDPSRPTAIVESEPSLDASQASPGQSPDAYGDRKRRSFLARRWPLALLAVAAAYLCLIRLDNTLFWDDDAQDAIIGRNFLVTGSLTGWDGRNLYAYHNGSILDDRLLFRNPPLAPLIAAASFRLFGASTWSARLPFALLGILSVILLMRLYAEEFPDDDAGVFYAAGAMALSPEFLLNARQCRYYMPCMLLGLGIYWAYARYLRRRSLWAAAAIATGAVLFFYSNWMLCAGFLFGLATVHCLFNFKAIDKKGWLWLILAGEAFLYCTVHYAVSRQIWIRPDMPDVHALSWAQKTKILEIWHFREMNLINVLPWTMVLCFALVKKSTTATDARNTQTALKWLALGAANLAWLAVLSPQRPEITLMADMRYLIVSVPFFAGFVGWTLARMHRVRRFWAIALFLALLSSNVLSYLPSPQWQFYWLLPAYLREVHNPYPTSIGETVHYLERHAKQNETAYVYPDVNNFPVMFYVGDKLRFCCTLDKDCILPQKTIRALGAPLYMEENLPDWLVCFGANNARQAIKRLGRGHYKFVTALNAHYIDNSRPEIPWHKFTPRRGFDPMTDGVLIYRKMTD